MVDIACGTGLNFSLIEEVIGPDGCIVGVDLTGAMLASIDEWIMRRPWEAIRAAMQEELADGSCTELFFGTEFLAAGSAAIEPSVYDRRKDGHD